MRYDPIMCMMVDDTVKIKDKKTIDASFNVVYKSNTGTMQALVMAASEKEAEQKVRSREGSKFVSLIGVKKMSDSNTLDNAIKNCDANWAEAYKEMENVMNKFSMQGISASIIYDRVKELYMKHKGDPAWETAWQKFNN